MTAVPFLIRINMTIKTYRTRELKGYVLHFSVDGKMESIAFKRGCTLGSTATYTTSNKRIQDAMESLNAFGPVFYLDDVKTIGEEAPVVKTKAPENKVEEQQEVEEKEVVDMLDAQTFKNLVELRNALKAKGIDVSQITNVKAAESLARKNGYNYIVKKED